MDNTPSPQNNTTNQYTYTAPEQSDYTNLGNVQNQPFVPETISQKRNWLRSIAYLPEYFVMLVLLVTIVSALTTLVGVGVTNMLPEQTVTSSSYGSSMTSGIDSFQLTWSLAALVSALPVFAWLFVRTRNQERYNHAVKQHRWRQAFLGAFLAIEGLTIVWTIGDLAYDLIGRIVGGKDGLLSYFSSGQIHPWWGSVIITIASVGIIAFVLFVMSRDYRIKEN